MDEIYDLLFRLQVATVETPNSTHYFAFSRQKQRWIFRFQQILVEVEGEEFRKTKFFSGKDPKLVLQAAVEFLEGYRREAKELDETPSSVYTNG
jgi:hypothetical protein